MVIRFIYTYKERTSGRPVYVGSTLDTKTRQRIRVYRLCCPFDRELAAHPEKYEHSILEVFKTNTDEESRRLCVLRENHWMDVLDTYRTPHGFNFQRANIQHYDREAWLAARQRSQTTPEALAKKSNSQKAAWNNPETRARMLAGFSVKANATKKINQIKHIENFLCKALQTFVKRRESLIRKKVRHKNRYKLRKLKGTCVQCNNNARTGKIYCETCAKINCEYSKTHREQNNIAKKKYRTKKLLTLNQQV